MLLLILFHQHLLPSGKVIIDLFLQTDFEMDRTSTRTWKCENGDLITLESKMIEVDHVQQHTITHNRYEKWRDGALIQSELERFPLRGYGVEEFKLLLERMGFEDITVSADYGYAQNPTKETEIITYEAYK